MRDPLQWSGGVNALEDPQSIEDNQLVQSKNAYPTLSGTLDKREPVKAVGSVEDEGVLSAKPVTLFVPDPVLGLDFILHGTYGPPYGEFLAAIQLNDTIKRLTPDGKSVFYNTADNSLHGQAVFANYKGRVIAVVGDLEGFYQLNVRPSGAFYWTRCRFSWPVATAGVLALQSQSEPVQPKAVCSYRGRLVFANFGRGRGNWLVFGDRDAQVGWTNVDDAPTWAIVGNDVLADNGRHLELASIQGEEIIGIREISLSSVGSPLQTALLVLTNRSAVICTGEPAQTIDTSFSTPAGYIGSFEASKVNYDVGLCGPNAMCVTPYGLCWASADEVWLMNGNTPVAIGTKIRPILRNTPVALRTYWSMAYANGLVFLAVATQASTTERDLRIQHWRLDMRGMPNSPPTWYGPQDYESLPDNATAGDANGTAMACSIVTKKTAGESDVVYGAIQARGITTASRPTTFIVSFNQGQGGEDSPFFLTLTGRVWSASDFTDGNVIPLGDVVRPTVYKANGRLYIASAVTTGIPGAIEPVWPTVDGGTVVDGGVTWKEIVNDTKFNRLPSYYGTGYPLSFLMDVYFKDNNFKVPSRDKLIRRADITSYFNFKSLVSLRAIINQGAWKRILGPTTIGGKSLAANDLGLAILDSASLGNEYQARALRPGPTATDPLTSYNADDTGLMSTGGIIRGRSIQFRFNDDTGIIIDDTNNYLTFCTYTTTKPVVVAELKTINLTKGRYNTVDDLLTHIAALMSTAQDLMTQGIAFTWGPNSWSYDSAYGVNNYPYMTTMTFAFGGRRSSGGNPYAVAFLFGDVTEDATTYLGVVCYPKRGKRLLALLGYDTTSRYRDSSGFNGVFADGTNVQLIGEQESPILASPTRLCGVQSIPPTRSPVVSLSDIEVDYYTKPGLPLSKVSR